ncbi:hypothetical protein [Rhizobium grahamii]|uniref:Uncharacterized protein n=1 Tax=Rhizobium grahamii TaxID=1120045 RepID=A0A370KWX2_9HYPH|nr:hypothetical protein [Rhizobium grahamii]RDJ16948.1 hypothetical protein B5K06_00765 [Rhizobium grahamii]
MLELFGALVGDYMAAASIPLAATGPAAGALTLRVLLEKRTRTARDILLAEIRQGRSLIEFHDADEAAAITYRYMRAAEEGAARLNLRLLAGVIVGSAEGPGLYADDFLRWADILAGLKREEVITLGVIQRLAEQPPVVSADIAPSLQFWLNCSEVLQREYGLESHAATATAHALLRTGLVQLVSGSMEIVVVPAPTHELSNLSALLLIEGIITRENSARFEEPAER